MAENPASTKRKTSDGAPNDGTPNDGTPDEKTSSDDKGSNKRVKIVEGQPLSIQDRFEAVKCQMDEVLHAAQHQASDATLKFEEKCEELEAIKMKLEAAQSEARELKRDKLSNMAINGPQGPEDGEVESAFSQLAYFVDAIGQEYFQGSECVRIAEEKQVVRAYFKSLLAKDTGCEGYGPYMKSAKPQAKEMFIQAVIWNKLIEKLLSTPSRSFLDMPDAINKKDALCVHRQATFHALRAQTATILFDTSGGNHPWGAHGRQREEFVKETMALLRNYSDCVEKGRQRTTEMKSRLEEIVGHAFTLASAMARSRAYWVTCTTELLGFKIDTNCMEAVNLWGFKYQDGEGMSVHLVVTPALLKYGNSSGENYGKRRVASKAKVVTY